MPGFDREPVRASLMDDAELDCGETLARLVEGIHDIFVALFSIA